MNNSINFVFLFEILRTCFLSFNTWSFFLWLFIVSKFDIHKKNFLFYAYFFHKKRLWATPKSIPPADWIIHSLWNRYLINSSLLPYSRSLCFLKKIFSSVYCCQKIILKCVKLWAEKIFTYFYCSTDDISISTNFFFNISALIAL